MTRRLVILPTLAALLVLAPSASAAQRYASQLGVGTSCSSILPCTLETAVNSAGAADEVIVAAGTYTVSTALDLDQGAAIHGQAGQARPVLRTAANGVNGALLSVDEGGYASGLRVESDAPNIDALSIKGGALVEDIIAISGGGDGAKVVGEPGDTVLRDSVVVSRSTGSSFAAIKLRDGPQGGNIVVRNVTAWAPNGAANGVRCETNVGMTSIINSAVGGAGYDIDASGSSIDCEAINSNFRRAFATGSLAETDVQTTPAVFEAVASDDFRPKATSPTIDAGTTSGPWAGTTDPNGAARTTGGKPDIGAYEHPSAGGIIGGVTETVAGAVGGPVGGVTSGLTGTTTGTDGQAGTTPADATGQPGAPAATTPPQIGRSVVLDAGVGTVLVKLPGSGAYVPLADARTLPTGTTVDASRGEVTLTSALPGGKVQTGTFGGGRFEIRQDPEARGMTDILLRGGSFAACRKAARRLSAGVRAFTAASRRPKPVRRLWARDKGGRFRTHGANSVATVRGTRWLTEDRCDGTFTKVTEGAVDVRDKRTGRTTRVRAGRSVLVRAPR